MEPTSYWMRSLVPFSVVGSNTSLVDGDGTKYRGREYPWGVVNIEDQVGLCSLNSSYLSLCPDSL